MTLSETEYPALLAEIERLLAGRGAAGRAKARELLRRIEAAPIYPGLALRPGGARAFEKPARRTAPCVSPLLAGEIEAPASWRTLAERIARDRPRRVFILGATDTGKSTLAAFLAARLARDKIRAAVLDCDLGQTDIGPPACFGLALVRRPFRRLAEVPPAEIAFVGSHSPALHFAPSLAAFARLAARGLAESEVLLVNTNGWISGGGGRAYKRAKMEILPPDLAVLLERADEIEHLVRHISERRIARLDVPRAARKTPPGERKALREAAYAGYFSRARRIEVRAFATEGSLYGTGEPLPVPRSLARFVRHAERLAPGEGTLVVHRPGLAASSRARIERAFPPPVRLVSDDAARGVLVGLQGGDGKTLTLGLLERLDWARRRAVLRSPISSRAARLVRRLRFGSLRITSAGREAGFLPPGAF